MLRCCRSAYQVPDKGADGAGALYTPIDQAGGDDSQVESLKQLVGGSALNLGGKELNSSLSLCWSIDFAKWFALLWCLAGCWAARVCLSATALNQLCGSAIF